MLLTLLYVLQVAVSELCILLLHVYAFTHKYFASKMAEKFPSQLDINEQLICVSNDHQKIKDGFELRRERNRWQDAFQSVVKKSWRLAQISQVTDVDHYEEVHQIGCYMVEVVEFVLQHSETSLLNTEDSQMLKELHNQMSAVVASVPVSPCLSDSDDNKNDQKSSVVLHCEELHSYAVPLVKILKAIVQIKIKTLEYWCHTYNQQIFKAWNERIMTEDGKCCQGKPIPVSMLCILYKEAWCSDDEIILTPLEHLNRVEYRCSGPIKGETVPFADATLKYLDKYYQEEGVHRVPAALFHQNMVKLGKNSLQNLDAFMDERIISPRESYLKKLKEVQRKEIISKRIASRAVEDVVRALVTWGNATEQNMFIFTEYEYKSYLRNSISNVTYIKGDHDVFVICEKIGVMFFQVKSISPGVVDKTKKNKIREAFLQSKKDHFVFIESNRDLNFVLNLPVYKFVAIPNIEKDDGVLVMHLCKEHRNAIVTKTALQTLTNFTTFMKSIKVGTNLAFTRKQYRLLCSRYVGLASVVKLRRLSDVIKKTGQKIHILLFTPDQKAILDADNHFQVLAGNFGTGKSFLLAEIARRLAEECKKNIILLTCADIKNSGYCNLDMSTLLKANLKQLVGRSVSNEAKKYISVISFDSLLKSLLNVKGNTHLVTKSDFVKVISNIYTREDNPHLLIDEVPRMFVACLKELVENSSLDPDRYVWFCVATHSYTLRKNNEVDSIVKLQNDCPSYFNFAYISHVMRIPENVFRLLRAVETFSDSGHHQLSHCGHVLNGPMPLLFSVPPCTCAAQSGMPIECPCSVVRMADTLCAIFNKIKGTDVSSVTILVCWVWNPKYMEAVCNLLEAASKEITAREKSLVFKLEFRTEFMSKSTGSKASQSDKAIPTVMVVDERTFIGCESVVVILIDLCAMRCVFPQTHGGTSLLALTRSLGQLVYVTWCDGEAQCMWEALVKGYKIWIEKQTEVNSCKRNEWKDMMNRWDQSDGSCLKRLLSEHVIEQCPVIPLSK